MWHRESEQADEQPVRVGQSAWMGAVILACAAGLASAGCGGWLGGKCSEPSKEPVESGSYETAGSEGEVHELVHGELESPTVQVKKEQDIVEVTYRRDGEEVVETWAITEARYEYE